VRSYATRSTATPLAWAYVALVLYASLFPFSGWRWPPGQGPLELMALPWPRWQGRFDIVSNLVGYVPLGLLLCIAQLRQRRPAWWALLFAGGVATGLSYLTEFTQNFLPERYPSVVDLLLNGAGAALGALLAIGLKAAGGLQRWQMLRERWFYADASAGLALMALWPVALLFPAPVALGLGQVVERLRQVLLELLANVPWAQHAAALLEAAAPWPQPPSMALEGAVQFVGLLAPCLLAFALGPASWRRGALALLVAVGGFLATTLCTALSFGPEHALAWVSDTSVLAWAAALLLAGLGCMVPSHVAATLGLMALTALAVLVAQVDSDPYFALSLQAWEQGRFIRFNGLAQWIGWLWPYATLAWLFTRLDRTR
jgi:VanZ family protein